MSAGTSEFFCLICLLVCSCTALEITAEVGQDVILPCKVPNNKNINDITAVEWIRPDLDPEYVLLYRNKRFDPDSQNPSYQNRVDLQDKEMKDGNFSLILKNVTMEDTGTYMCRVFQKGKKYLISTIFLKVYLSAQEKITAELGQDVILPCKVPNNNNITAVQWIRPGLGSEYVLLYQDGHLDPDNQHPSYQNRVDLQDKQMKDGDVSLILMNVKMEDTGTYECFAFHETKNELICIINLEVRLSVSDVPLKVQPSNTWTIVGWTLVVIILSAVGFAVYKKLQIRTRKKEKKEKQEDIERLMGNYSETKNQLQQVTQENEALKNKLKEKLKRNHSETSIELQQEKQRNENPGSRLRKKLKRSHSDPSIELQQEKQRNENLNSHLRKLEALQDENQMLKETVGYLKTELQNMKLELMGTKTAEVLYDHAWSDNVSSEEKKTQQ